MELKEKIKNKDIRLAVIGLGYVGLPLCVEFCKGGLTVVGIDNNSEKVRKVNCGESYIGDITDETLKGPVLRGSLTATTDYSVLAECDAVSICVPTPLRKTREPDISYIQKAVSEVRKYLHPNMIVILESTTYPGTTEEVILPELAKSGLSVGKDYFLAFSPERVDPSNKKYQTRNTPKVIGGITDRCTALASELYMHAVDTVVPVSSTRAAELVKLLENTFRAINIGFVNELALICNRLGLDVWEIIDAAKTKPFGFMPFYPGPGIGGHCIPIDPLYLTWKLRTLNSPTRFITLADEINSNMPVYVVNKSAEILNRSGKPVNGSSVLVLGAAYKKNINDFRESPAIDVIGLLAERGARVSLNDDLTGDIRIGEITYPSQTLTRELISRQDLVIMISDHDYYDRQMIARFSQCILDTRNTFSEFKDHRDKIFKL